MIGTAVTVTDGTYPLTTVDSDAVWVATADGAWVGVPVNPLNVEVGVVTD